MREQQDWLLAAEEENLRTSVIAAPDSNGVDAEVEEKAHKPESEEVR